MCSSVYGTDSLSFSLFLSLSLSLPLCPSPPSPPLSLGDLEEFSKLPTDMTEAPQRFQEWYNHVTPETEKLPLDWSGLDKTPFLKLLVVRCLRPDRLNMATENWVRGNFPDGHK